MIRKINSHHCNLADSNTSQQEIWLNEFYILSLERFTVFKISVADTEEDHLMDQIKMDDVQQDKFKSNITNLSVILILNFMILILIFYSELFV